MIRKMIPLALTLALLAGCGAPSETTNETSGSAPPAASASPTSAASPSTDQPSPAPSTSTNASASPASSASGGAVGVDLGGLTGEAGVLAQQALTQLASVAGVSANDLSVQSVKAVEWSSGGLGCEAPGQMYTQAIVPGYQIVVTDGTRQYDIHASQQGQVIWCDNGQPKSLSN